METAYIKIVMNVNEVAEFIGIDIDSVNDLINNGDLPAIGSKKDMVRLCDLHSFLGMDRAFLQNDMRPVDFSGKQRSNAPHSIIIEDISEKEWDELKKTGAKEHKPYFDGQKNRWCIALSLGKNEQGKRIRKVISGATQADLWDAYREFMREQDKKQVAPIVQDAPIVKEGLAGELGLATYRPEQDVLFSDCYAKFLKGLESTIVNRTYGSYIATAKYIVEKLGNLKMYELNTEIVQTFMNELRDDTYVKGGKIHYYGQSKIDDTFNLLHRFIREYSDSSHGKAILDYDFMAGLNKPRTNALKSPEVVPYTGDNISAILDAVSSNKMVYCWVHIMSELGCRPSEALGLTWDDIDYDNKTIYINKALGKKAKYDPVTHKRLTPYRPIIKDLKNDKGRKGRANYQCRRLKVSDATLDAIKEWRRSLSNDKKLSEARQVHGTMSFLFTGVKGNQCTYDDYKQQYDRLLEKQNLDPSKMNPYRFRHTVCTDLLRSGLDLKTVQMIMGDNTPDMILRVYANVQQEDALASSSALSDRMANIVGKGQTAANV